MTEEQMASIDAAVADFAAAIGEANQQTRERVALAARQHAYGRLIFTWGQRWVLDNVGTIKDALNRAEGVTG